MDKNQKHCKIGKTYKAFYHDDPDFWKRAGIVPLTTHTNTWEDDDTEASLIYPIVGYDEDRRKMYYNDRNLVVNTAVLSADRSKVFLLCENEYTGDDVDYLIDIKTGEVLYMNISSHFRGGNPSVYYGDVLEQDGDFFITHETDEGIFIFDKNFDTCLTKEKFRPIRGTFVNNYLLVYKDNKWLIVNLRGEIKKKVTSKPDKILSEFLEKGLYFVKSDNNSEYYDLMNETKVIAKELRITDFYQIKFGTQVYNKNWNLITLSTTPKIEKTGIDLCEPILTRCGVDDFKIYFDSKGDVCIAEKCKIPVKHRIKQITDIERHQTYVANFQKTDEFNEVGETIVFFNERVKSVKVILDNDDYNIYKLGEGWKYKNEDDSNLMFKED